MTTSCRWSLLAVLLMFGCWAKTEGTESAARKYFDAEFKKCMAGETNTVATKQSKWRLLAPPISHDVRSIVHRELTVCCRCKVTGDSQRVAVQLQITEHVHGTVHREVRGEYRRIVVEGY